MVEGKPRGGALSFLIDRGHADQDPSRTRRRRIAHLGLKRSAFAESRPGPTACASSWGVMLELEPWAVEARRLLQEGVWPSLLCAFLAVINASTVVLYAQDKRAARRRGAPRIPERTLHTFELLGGWPGALLAQRWLRHKTVKPAYQRVFRGIVALHLLLAIAACGLWVAAHVAG